MKELLTSTVGDSPEMKTKWIPLIRTRWNVLINWLAPPKAEEDQSFKESKDWVSNYSPVGLPENGEFLVDFAKNQYDLIRGMVDELDKKADDLMRTILAVFGALLTLVTLKVISIDSGISVLTVAGLFSQFTGLLIATFSRIPTSLQTPTSPKDLIMVSDGPSHPTKAQLQSAVAASYHLAYLGEQILNKWKSNRLKLANRLFLLGLVLLAIALPVNYWTDRSHRSGGHIKVEWNVK